MIYLNHIGFGQQELKSDSPSENRLVSGKNLSLLRALPFLDLKQVCFVVVFVTSLYSSPNYRSNRRVNQ